ncbi:SusC/RagA family TonB-linked outer membrane protein [Flagellimonas sediminis]|uniref:SusC/RagA family TonB-linked outer membrane protein n=1 Tax=Flagellimonas sediminis TaxID=2696468 RepID=A0A6I5L3M2_9FLAO|nr:SusC/RagA family TonB-linked outer membrane protein [Allomuricauda sediminis]NDV44718.1 SusC/RagA family TonB-linked outer membrane protein [Allomuricauda sediminis]
MKNYIKRTLPCLTNNLSLTVKLTVFLFIVSFFSTHANSYSQKTRLTLAMDNVEIEQVFEQIESVSEFKFFYDNKKIDTHRKVTVSADQQLITEILDQLFQGTNILYIFNKQQIVLKLRPNVLEAPNSKSGRAETAPVQNTVSGKVTDATGAPIPGASVIEKGTTNGVAADFDGLYQITVQNPNAILVVSSIGFAKKEVPVGGASVVNVVLQEDTQNLNEVVVTALGIKQETKKLGYSVAQVDADEVNVNRSSNFMNTLQGKVAGVNISSLSTGPGGSSKVRIRGQSSISGTNNPLIVVNGVPIDNTTFGTSPGSTSTEVGTNSDGVFSDGGDGFSSINPDDIESMTILKGATGAALYGSRAKDGVIMITTKSRGSGDGLGITYNLNVTNHTPLDFTDYQYQYGQGENGVRPTSANPTSGQWSFGERFEPGMTQILFNGIEVPYVPVYDRIKKFYRNGLDVTNSISFAGGNEKGGFNVSLSNLKSEGITPNNEFARSTISLGTTYNLSDDLSFEAHINYSNEKNTNPPNVGQQDNTIPVSLFNLANSMPLDVLEANKFDENGNEYVYSRFRNRTNPYFTLSEQFNNIKRDRIFGNIALKYNILPWLNAQLRGGQDYWSRSQDYNGFPTGQASRAAAPEGFVNGTYTQEARRFRETNVDFLISANKDISEDLSIGLNVGGNRMKRTLDVNRVDVTDFVIRDLYTVQNGRVKDPSYSLSERAVNSLYGAADISFQDTYFLSATLRNDWFSTLSPENRSILYPSVAASYIVSNAFAEQPDWLTFAKLRIAYAEVGSDTDVPPYSDALFYDINSNFFPNNNGDPQPVAGANTSTLPNPDLRPMRTKETEIGLDLRMFDNRVGLDVAVYRKTTIDQIIPAQISNTSGFVSTLINSGESRSDGVEAMLSLNPIRTNDFRWDVNVNTSYNKTKVISLLTDTPGESILVGNHVFNGFLYQVVGEEIGQLAGFGYKRDEQGRQIFGDDGRALRTDEIQYFGSALPKWIGGITNTFKYKDFNFSFLIDFKLGNKMISGTNFNAVRHGLHKMTLPGRDTGVIGDGVNQAGDTNTVATESQRYWEVVRSSQIIEPIVYNGGYWKLRQVTLGYDFKKFIPEDSFLRGATLSLVANNVLLLKKWVDNIDPDSFSYSSDNVSGLESTGVPTTRSMGFNLNLKF